MTTPLTINVHACEDRGRSNGFLSTTFESNQKDAQQRSHSAAPSERSHTTVVEENSDVPNLKCPGPEKDNQFERQKEKPTKQGLIWNHLRQVKRHLSGIIRVLFTSVTPITGNPETIISEPDNGFVTTSSAYIRGVYVLSTEKYDEHHFCPKYCRCIFDTGNHQGNLVSKTFLLERLGYTESDFLRLTETEQSSGFGITNHPFVPLGAIRLTWYHDMSTRLFSDMRFLISPYSHTDLIIGAQSIEQYNILGKPNFASLTNREPEPERSKMQREKGKLRNEIAWCKEQLRNPSGKTDDQLKLIAEKQKNAEAKLAKLEEAEEDGRVQSQADDKTRKAMEKTTK
ncbi:hypothetical protein BP5796_07641 [Coleophoma crateriformis]|uniref:Uncharacterized protein n=1 Tax=Coleophoma crateriformis TaxID=565419 RepID=A0A3D8RJH4_9HELO|nr:hypothetical protein BP5796_07641 [Coleophoma crateriformis]